MIGGFFPPSKEARRLQDFLERLHDLLTIHIDIDNSIFSAPLKGLNLETEYYRAEYVQNKIEYLFAMIFEQYENNNLLKYFKYYLIFFFASASKLTEIVYELYLDTMNLSVLSEEETYQLLDEYQSNERHRVEEGGKLNYLIEGMV